MTDGDYMSPVQMHDSCDQVAAVGEHDEVPTLRHERMCPFDEAMFLCTPSGSIGDGAPAGDNSDGGHRTGEVVVLAPEVGSDVDASECLDGVRRK